MNIHLTSYGQGTPLVFFHGWGFDSQIWMSLVPKLEDAYRVILVDLPGFGLSSMMEWAAFKEQLLALLPEQFVLIGWSLGGLYATRLAIESPERIMALFNVTSSPRFIMDADWPGLSQSIFLKFYHNLSADLEGTLKDFITLQANSKTFDYIPHNLPSQAALEAGLNILDTWDLREDLKPFQTPTCFVFGRLDPITSVKTMDAMQVLFPQFKYLVFRKSAHMPFLSQPEAFIEALLGFIS